MGSWSIEDYPSRSFFNDVWRPWGREGGEQLNRGDFPPDTHTPHTLNQTGVGHTKSVGQER